LIPTLTLIYQIYNGELEEQEAVNKFKSLATIDSGVAGGLVKKIATYRGQPHAYRKWIIKIAPYPSTAHFEYMVFGKRVDRRSRWAKLGNKAHASIFSAVKSVRADRPTFTTLLEVSKHLTPEIQLGFLGAVFSFREGLFDTTESERWFNADPSTEPAAPRATIPSKTHRSRTNSTRHNSQRFARWIETTTSPNIIKEIRHEWDIARWDFRASVQAILGEQRLLQFLAESGEPQNERY
jgi:hypothetical protein